MEVFEEKIKEMRNSAGQLHSLTRPATILPDGTPQHYIDGYYFQQHLWELVRTKNVDACFAMPNIEQRRIALKYCLDPRTILINFTGVALIDKDKRGNTLYEYKHEKLIEPMKILVYKDSSDEKICYSLVPPSMTEATRAMAWKFQLTAEEYEELHFEA